MTASIPHANGSQVDTDLISRFIGIISARREEVLGSLTRKQVEIRELPQQEVADQGDRASNAQCRDTMHADLARLAKEQKRLDAAYARIQNGSYGICSDPGCKDQIDEERLEANPCAVFCRDCATQRDTTGNPKLPRGTRGTRPPRH